MDRSSAIINCPSQAGGTYVPVTGDFDGDGCDDIWWHKPGTAADPLWWGRPDRTFDTAPVGVDPNGTFIPISGNFDGDAYDDIYFYAPGTATDRLFWGRAAAPSSVMGSRRT